jgi:putative hydrolase of the HAD superfamily
VRSTNSDRRPVGRLALFDLDNTLFDRAAAYREWCADFVLRHHLGEEAIDLLLAADNDGHAARAHVFEPLCARFDLAQSPTEIEAEYRAQYPTYFRSNPAVLDGIKAVRTAGWTVVIVTNGPPTQIAKIERCGLDDAVDGWVISDVVGSAKPDRGIFEAAAGLVGRALDGWMVGDTSSADVVGGRAVGLATIWLARGRPRPATPELVADVTVENIFEAFATILSP